jgi:hypothetical protein
MREGQSKHMMREPMKKLVLSGAALAALFLCTKAHADVVSISTSVPTAIVSSSFGSKTIMLESTSGTVLLNSQAIVSTQTFVNNSFGITASSGIIVIPNFHGTIYGEAPTSAASVNLFYLGGQ